MKEDVIVVNDVISKGSGPVAVMTDKGEFQSWDEGYARKMMDGNAYRIKYYEKDYKGKTQRTIYTKVNPVNEGPAMSKTIGGSMVETKPATFPSGKGTDRRAMCMAYSKDIVVGMMYNGMIRPDMVAEIPQLVIDVFHDIVNAIEQDQREAQGFKYRPE